MPAPWMYNERLALFVPKLESIAAQKKNIVVDVYRPLQKVLDYYAPDRIHMLPGGQEIITKRIVDKIMQNIQ